MRTARKVGVGLLLIVLCRAGAAGAHHGGTVAFDRARTVSLTGTVTNIEWQHPHTGFGLDVSDATGAVTHWVFVLEGAGNLVRRGWTRSTLRPGDQVSVRGFGARDGSLVANAVAVTRADGRSVVEATPKGTLR